MISWSFLVILRAEALSCWNIIFCDNPRRWILGRSPSSIFNILLFCINWLIIRYQFANTSSSKGSSHHYSSVSILRKSFDPSWQKSFSCSSNAAFGGITRKRKSQLIRPDYLTKPHFIFFVIIGSICFLSLTSFLVNNVFLFFFCTSWISICCYKLFKMINKIFLPLIQNIHLQPVAIQNLFFRILNQFASQLTEMIQHFLSLEDLKISI